MVIRWFINEQIYKNLNPIKKEPQYFISVTLLFQVGRGRIELPTSCLSSMRSKPTELTPLILSGKYTK